MRELIATTVFICAAIAACVGASAKDANLQVFVDGRKTKLNPPAMMRDGKVYVGLRGIAKALKASTRWDEKSKTAIVTVGNKRTRVKQSEGITVDGVLFLPLRATGEAVGCTVEWDSVRRAVKITKEAPAPRCGG